MAGCFIEESPVVVEEFTIGCPYCGEMIDMLVESSVEEQEYYEDCSVCCCPILCKQAMDEHNKLTLIVKKDDE